MAETEGELLRLGRQKQEMERQKCEETFVNF